MAGLLTHNPRSYARNQQAAGVRPNISAALNFIIKQEDINSKEDLDAWCGNKGRNKLYSYIKFMAPDNWVAVQNPKATVRSCYEIKLTGYKLNEKRAK